MYWLNEFSSSMPWLLYPTGLTHHKNVDHPGVPLVDLLFLCNCNLLMSTSKGKKPAIVAGSLPTGLSHWLYTIGRLDWWIGLVDWTTGLTDFHQNTLGCFIMCPNHQHHS